MPSVSRLPLGPLLVLLAALAALGVAGCGSDGEELHVVEGEPLELGELSYNVQITRFLNPDDAEDAEYLAGQDPPPPGSAYLASFLTIDNDDDSPHHSASDYGLITAPEGEEFEPIESESPYALEIGVEVPAEGSIPIPDTTAATGPIAGSMLLFLVPDEVTESRPLELEITSEGETGTVELDI